MTPLWKTVHRFDVPEAPAHLTITAWGRRFRVAPVWNRVRAVALTSDVVHVEVVGPTVALALEPPMAEDVIDVDVVEDFDEDITRVGAPSADVLELVYEVAGEEDSEITAVTPNPTHGRTCVGRPLYGNTEGRHG